MTSLTLSSLLGGALGDALGYSREFVHMDSILQALPAEDWRRADFTNAPASRRETRGYAEISDDTQMTIATARAILSTDRTDPSAQQVSDALIQAYVTWSNHPDNTRAPGGACMSACRLLAKGFDWQDATGIDAMGCGANMRVAPIALCSDYGPRTARDIAQLSSVITHAHPGAVAATALTADAIRAAQQGYTGTGLLDLLLTQCTPGMTNYYPHWVLGDLWEQSEYTSPEAYMNAGYEICARYLHRAAAALGRGWAGQTDPCIITGEAWTAPEALAGAVLCAAGLWDNPVEILQRAACSNGDSDSLAAIAGSIRGAGGAEWPQEWVDHLEAKPVAELRKIAAAL